MVRTYIKFGFPVVSSTSLLSWDGFLKRVCLVVSVLIPLRFQVEARGVDIRTVRHRVFSAALEPI